jgi:hypothetical protein
MNATADVVDMSSSSKLKGDRHEQQDIGERRE